MALRKLLLIALLFPILGTAQTPLHKLVRKKASVGGCALLLDSHPADAVYSLMREDCDFSGPVIRVRESGGDTEMDIGLSGDGLDEDALLSFVGANNGYIVTWYDQSGNGRDATQATEANQPLIVESGTITTQNGLPSIKLTGGNQELIGPSFTLAQPATYFIVGKNDGTNNVHFIDGVVGRHLIGTASGNFVSYAGSILTFAANSTAFSLYYALFNGSSSALDRNASGVVTGDAGSQNMSDGFYIGAGSGGDAIVGFISAIYIYASDKSADKTAIEANINSRYSIY